MKHCGGNPINSQVQHSAVRVVHKPVLRTPVVTHSCTFRVLAEQWCATPRLSDVSVCGVPLLRAQMRPHAATPCVLGLDTPSCSLQGTLCGAGCFISRVKNTL